MARDRRSYDDDDGRTIVDMSGVERPNMFFYRKPAPPGIRPENVRRELMRPEEKKPERPWEDNGWNRSDRRAAVGGALKAALLIGGAYIVGLGALVAILMYVIW